MGSSATKNSQTPKKGSWQVTCSPRNFWFHTHRTLKLFIMMRSVARSPLEEFPKKGRSSTCKLHKLQWRTATMNSLGFLYQFSFFLPFFLLSSLFHCLNTWVIFTVPKKLNITIPNSKVMLLILAQIRKMLLAAIQWITKSQLQNHYKYKHVLLNSWSVITTTLLNKVQKFSIRVNACIQICIYIQIYTCMCINFYYIYTNIHIYIFINTYKYMCVCEYMCV